MFVFRLTLLAMLVMVTTTFARPIHPSNITPHGHRQVPIFARRTDHWRRDNQGDVKAHDGYESQLHALEAALKHYEEYGDAKSLETYLKGFDGDDGSTGGDGGQGGEKGAQNSAQDGGKSQDQKAGHSNDKTPAKDQTDGDKAEEQKPADKKQDQPQQQQPSEDDCEPSSDDHQDDKQGNDEAQRQSQQDQQSQKSQQTQQSQRTPQTQPKMVKKPQSQSPQSYTAPTTSDSGINGYLPPSFSVSSSTPSTALLYTSPPFTGAATFYNTGLGACGIVNTDTDPIVAISRDLFEQYNPASGDPNENALCGRKVEISWKGKKVLAYATDECPGCEGTSLDCSPSVFDQLDERKKGVLEGISWRFV